MRSARRGFTLIELMIVVAIIGILAAIAIPTFMTFSNKSKRSEARLQLDQIRKRIEIYHHTKRILPPSAPLFPLVEACDSPSGKITPLPQSAWDADPGWRELGFYVNEESYFQYEWTLNTPDNGIAYAKGDLDCDNVYSNMTVVVDLVEGNTFSATVAFLDDD